MSGTSRRFTANRRVGRGGHRAKSRLSLAMRLRRLWPRCLSRCVRGCDPLVAPAFSADSTLEHARCQPAVWAQCSFRLVLQLDNRPAQRSSKERRYAANGTARVRASRHRP
jgi:hypothetical protein